MLCVRYILMIAILNVWSIKIRILTLIQYFYRIHFHKTTAMAQWVRAFALQAEGLVFESLLRQTLVVKTGSDSSTAKRSADDVSVTGLGDDHSKL